MTALYRCPTSSQQLAHLRLEDGPNTTKVLSFDKRGIQLHGATVTALNGKDAGKEISDGIINPNVMVEVVFGTAMPSRELLLVANPALADFAMVNGVQLYAVSKEAFTVKFTLFAIRRITLSEIGTHLATAYLLD